MYNQNKKYSATTAVFIKENTARSYFAKKKKKKKKKKIHRDRNNCPEVTALSFIDHVLLVYQKHNESKRSNSSIGQIHELSEQHLEQRDLKKLTNLATLHKSFADHSPFSDVKHTITICKESQVYRNGKDKSSVSSENRR